jgi:hypothetical protein
MATAQSDTVTAQSFDGNGGRVKTVETAYTDNGTNTTTTYYVHSSVLGGQVLTELTAAGAKQRTYVYSGSQVLAWQQVIPFYNTQSVSWEHRDPSNASFRVTNINGSIDQPAELDPLGSNAETSNPYLIGLNPDEGFTSYPQLGDLSYLNGKCRLDGIPYPCAELSHLMDIGVVESAYPGHWEHDPNQPGDARHPRLVPITRPIQSYGVGVFLIWTPSEFRGERDTSGYVLYVAPQDTTFDLPGITKLVDLELAEDQCAKFAETILNQLSKGKGGNLPDVLNAFLNQSKQHDLFTRILPEGSFGEATAMGKLKNSTASMFLRTDRTFQTETDADNVIQELFHFAGNGYNDKQLAEALNKTTYADDANKVFPDGTANIFDPR